MASAWRFLRFCLVGGVGFVVDAGMLECMARLGLPVMIARFCSIVIALSVTYHLHRHLTFRVEQAAGWREWMRFVRWNGAGAVLNYATFTLLVWLLDGVEPVLRRQGALVVACGVALCFNYWANMHRVFAQKSEVV